MILPDAELTPVSLQLLYILLPPAGPGVLGPQRHLHLSARMALREDTDLSQAQQFPSWIIRCRSHLCLINSISLCLGLSLG